MTPSIDIPNLSFLGGAFSNKFSISLSDSRYFMIKSWNSENVEIAQRDVSSLSESSYH